MLTHSTPLAIHVAGKSVRDESVFPPTYRQCCTQCGKVLSTEILGYPQGAKIAEDTHFVAMYIGDLEANCAAVKESAA